MGSNSVFFFRFASLLQCGSTLTEKTPPLEVNLFPYPFLTWKLVKESYPNSADPDQTPHHVASDQGLHCLLTGFSIKK